MKFTLATVLAFAAMAVAYPAVGNGSSSLRFCRVVSGLTCLSAPVKRQNIVTMDITQPAMSDGTGNVIPFDSTKVAQVAKAKRAAKRAEKHA
jgi:hypothetical protein